MVAHTFMENRSFTWKKEQSRNRKAKMMRRRKQTRTKIKVNKFFKEQELEQSKRTTSPAARKAEPQAKVSTA